MPGKGGLNVIETILLAVWWARRKGYSPAGLRRAKLLYPAYLLELCTIAFQVCVFCGVYTFIPYAPILKTSYMLALALPLIGYRLWDAGLLSAGCVFLGSFLNNLVMGLNGGKMPVFPTLSYLTGYVNSRNLNLGGGIHVLGDNGTRLKVLADYIDIGYSVLSIGDVLVRVMGFLAVYATLRHLSQKADSKELG